MTVYTIPEMSRIMPATPMAGVIAGWRGRGLVEIAASPLVTVAVALIETELEGAWITVLGVTEVDAPAVSLGLVDDSVVVEAAPVAFADDPDGAEEASSVDEAWAAAVLVGTKVCVGFTDVGSFCRALRSYRRAAIGSREREIRAREQIR